MFSALLSSIIEQHGYPVLAEDEVSAYAGARNHCVLFFAGDADRLMESNDLAVILPELIKASGGALVPIVAARSSERAMQRKYRFSAFPALVFLRRGEYLGAISRVHDWADYMREIPEILAREPSAPPPFRLPGSNGGESTPNRGHDEHDGHETHPIE